MEYNTNEEISLIELETVSGGASLSPAIDSKQVASNIASYVASQSTAAAHLVMMLHVGPMITAER